MLFILKEGLSDLKRAAFSTFFTTLVIFLSLLLINLYLHLSLSITKTMQDLKKDFAVDLFIADSSSTTSIDQLQKKLAKNGLIAKVSYISKEKAKELFIQEFGDDPETTIGYNPLPRSLRVQLKKEKISNKNLTTFVNSIKREKMVTDLIYDNNITKLEYQNFGRRFFYPVLVVISLLSIILIFNTIRLTIRHKQEIIYTMKLVGATNATIRTPFLISGLIQGMGGAVMAVIFSHFMLKLAHKYLFADFLILQSDISIPIALKIVGFGALLGFIGSYLAVRKCLNRY